jgi:hypothetical protein
VSASANESGRSEVWVRPVRRQGGKVLVSPDGGRAARWSRDGREIFYVHDETLMRVRVSESAGRLVVGTPEVRAQMQYFGGAVSNYAALSDGRLLIVRMESQPVNVDRLVVVQDWTSRLKTVATGR